MSFFTSFCDLPQKLQLRLSRFSKVQASGRGGGVGAASPVIVLGLGLRRLPTDEDVVDQPVTLRLVGPHEVVPLGVLLDLLEGLAGVMCEELVQLRLQAQDLLRLDLDVG